MLTVVVDDPQPVDERGDELPMQVHAPGDGDTRRVIEGLEENGEALLPRVGPEVLNLGCLDGSSGQVCDGGRRIGGWCGHGTKIRFYASVCK